MMTHLGAIDGAHAGGCLFWQRRVGQHAAGMQHALQLRLCTGKSGSPNGTVDIGNPVKHVLSAVSIGRMAYAKAQPALQLHFLP